jgi:calcium binding protein 39
MMLNFRYENQEVALNCGMILRESLRHESLTKQTIESTQFWKLFHYVELPTFDVASDAFATFKVILYQTVGLSNQA